MADARKPAQVPSDIKAFNRRFIDEFRANRGKLSGPMAGRSLLLLTTTGAKSGEARTTVLGYRPDGDRFLVIASGNGSPIHPAWYRNLQANPAATIEVGPDRIAVQASTADRQERPRLAALVPYLEGEQKKTSREIPIVVLKPSS